MIKPLPGYVLIEPIEDETEIDGVYLPDSSKDKPMKGKIMSIGKWNIPENVGIPISTWTEYKDVYLKDELSVNNIVFYKKWTNQEVNHEGKTYLLVHFNELLAVLE